MRQLKETFLVCGRQGFCFKRLFRDTEHNFNDIRTINN